MKGFRLSVIMLVMSAFFLMLLPGCTRNEVAEEWYNKGNDDNDFDKKIEYYTKAISIDQNFADAYFERGHVYSYLQKYNKAILDYNMALSINKNYTDAYLNRGVSYRAIGEKEKALADFKEACKRLKWDACMELRKLKQNMMN